MRQGAINAKTTLTAAAERVAHRKSLKAAATALAAHYADPKNIEEPRLSELGLFTDADLKAIIMVAHKQAKRPFSEKHFAKAMAETTPVVARPRTDDDLVALDFWRTLAQPEIL